MKRTIFNMRGLRGGATRLADTLGGVQRTLASVSATLPPQTGPAGLVKDVLARVLPGMPAAAGTAAVPPGSRFLQESFTCAEGSRPYRLFIPAGAGARPALIVMLHGCTQTAEDFAAGTRMNNLADKEGALVLYPVQVSSANLQRCWNWFNPADQQRDGGEAALIAAMTRSVMAAHNVDPKHVFVAGLSAGGAQAAILGAAYPDLFAAVGVHSGLACGAARDMPGAFAAMRQGREGSGRHRMRTIIFHGDRDTTVAMGNADAVADQVAQTASHAEQTEHGQVPGGLSYTRSIRRDPAGRPGIERWTVHGAGHAWSGGSPDGTFTEPRGPDASRAMMAFFLR